MNERELTALKAKRSELIQGMLGSAQSDIATLNFNLGMIQGLQFAEELLSQEEKED